MSSTSPTPYHVHQLFNTISRSPIGPQRLSTISRIAIGPQSTQAYVNIQYENSGTPDRFKSRGVIFSSTVLDVHRHVAAESNELHGITLPAFGIKAKGAYLESLFQIIDF